MRMSRRASGYAAAVLLLLVVTGGYGALRRSTSPAQRVADAAPPPAPVVTARVESRQLRDVVVLDGVVAPAEVTAVTPPPLAAGERAVVTKAPPRAGGVVREGDLLLAVAAHPVFVLRGAMPLYRDLAVGARGGDVVLLQRALRRLGRPTSDARGVYGAGTHAALAALWHKHGYALGPTVAATAFAVVPTGVATVVTSSAPLGAIVASDARLAELTGTAPVVTAAASPAQATLLKVGLTATFAMSDGASGEGRINSIGAVDEAGQSPVVARPAEPLPSGRIGSPVRIEVVVRSTSASVLAVPIAAVRSEGDGSDVVVLANPARTRVTVGLGPSIGGWVQIRTSSAPLPPGQNVVLSG